MQHKTFAVETLSKRANGGRIAISTSALDRQNDRVFMSGARTDKYIKNPIVQWGHSYGDPWTTVGKTTKLAIEPDRIIADFELRPPANEHDPQNIVRLLWDGGWIKAASIGFIPLRTQPNEAGGLDHLEWELLEWSLVQIPANASALALAAAHRQRRANRGAGQAEAQALIAGMDALNELIQEEHRRGTLTEKRLLDAIEVQLDAARVLLGV